MKVRSFLSSLHTSSSVLCISQVFLQTNDITMPPKHAGQHGGDHGPDNKHDGRGEHQGGRRNDDDESKMGKLKDKMGGLMQKNDDKDNKHDGKDRKHDKDDRNDDRDDRRGEHEGPGRHGKDQGEDHKGPGGGMGRHQQEPMMGGGGGNRMGNHEGKGPGHGPNAPGRHEGPGQGQGQGQGHGPNAPGRHDGPGQGQGPNAQKQHGGPGAGIGAGAAAGAGMAAGAGAAAHGNHQSRTKRGLCWPVENKKDDPSRFAQSGSKVSWYYNWSPHPTKGAEGQFVPMQWNAGGIKELAENVKRTNANTIMGFNEPELPDQANMSTDDAADAWMKHIEPLRKQGVRCGSPGISSAPQGVQWMQDFWGKIKNKGSDVDFWNFHWYGTDLGPFYDHIWST